MVIRPARGLIRALLLVARKHARASVCMHPQVLVRCPGAWWFRVFTSPYPQPEGVRYNYPGEDNGRNAKGV